MAGLPFLNTNLLLRHFTQDHAEHSPRATALIRRIEAGALTVWTADTAIFETVFTLQRFYRVPRAQIRDVMLEFLALPSARLAGKRRYRRVFELYVTENALSFADCYHVALIEARGRTDLISFDQGLDRVPTIMRREPDALGLLPD